ncbi:MAG: hypothetical protein M5U34_07215 [Chloroflexi bacterium]|nr:hypothetical protein [Chloroflexota bacterium]
MAVAIHIRRKHRSAAHDGSRNDVPGKASVSVVLVPGDFAVGGGSGIHISVAVQIHSEDRSGAKG